MPFDATCHDCWNHGPSDGLSGECRAGPPTEPTEVHRVLAYIRTADDLPACGLYKPKVEPEAPPPETKAERIARLCSSGKVSVAEIKRAIDGR
jgi:hypothetical protein